MTAASLLALLLFAWLAASVWNGVPISLDPPVLAAIQSWASPPFTAVMRAATELGGLRALLPLGALAAAVLPRARRWRGAGLLAAAALGGNLLNEGLKLVFRRPRPQPLFGMETPLTYSFPSGHALAAVCFYATVVLLFAPELRSRSARVAAWTGVVVLAALIGLSRVYLGMHYPSDVAGGYAAAVIWMAAIRAAGVNAEGPRAACPA